MSAHSTGSASKRSSFQFDPRSTDIAWVDKPFAFPLVSQLEPPGGKKKSWLVAHHFASRSFAVRVGSSGQKQETFHIPRDRLTANSGYFATLINGTFKGVESTDNVVTLDTEVDNVDAFRMFVDWLFIETYAEPQPAGGRGDGERCLSHARVYVLAERLCANQLKLVALKKMAVQLQMTYVEFGGKWRAALSAQTMIALVKTIYPYTRDAYAAAEDVPGTRTALATSKINFGTPPPNRDPMRMLIAGYASSAIEVLHKDRAFLELMRGWEGCEEFAGDLLLGVKKGDRIKPI